MITICRERLALACAAGLVLAALLWSSAAQTAPAVHAHVHSIASVEVAVDPAAMHATHVGKGNDGLWSHAATLGVN